MVRTTFLKLAAVCLISTTVPAVSVVSAALSVAQEIGLVERQANSCAVSGWQSCNLQGAQANFCCPAGSACVQFNNNASVICCPAGHNNCQAISPTTCDISQNNASSHPDNQLHSTDFAGPLTKCGNDCCPQGFSCENNLQCVMKANAVVPSSTNSAATTSGAAASSTSGKSTSTSASSLPTTTLPVLSSSRGTSSSSKTVSTTASSSSSASSTPTNAPITANSSTATATANANPFPAPAVLAGFFPGLLLGILLTIGIILCLGRRRSAKKAQKSKPASSDFSSVTATVSDPIYDPRYNTHAGGPMRTDFLRRDSRKMFHPSLHHSPFSTPSPVSTAANNNRASRVRSLFSRSPTSRDGIGRSIPPRTPEMEHYRTPDLKHEPSTESIKIYSPPNIALGGDVRNTRFTDMMRDAGFRAGEPFLGSPARLSRGEGGRMAQR